MGNIINRVFESSGPDGKVRGTPQQIIEKYLVLARDAQLSNDRVAAENFLQHAEHYTRMLGEAQREMAAEQEARRHQGGGQPHGHAQGGAPQEGRERFGGPIGGQAMGQTGGQNRIRYDRDDEQPHIVPEALMAVDYDDDGDSILIETPEARRSVVARDDSPAEPEAPASAAPASPEDAPRGAESQEARGPRRGPRRGRGGGGGGGASDPASGSAAAQ
jgi:hypothetical protein